MVRRIAPHRWARWIGRTWARLSYALRVEPTWLATRQFDIAVPGLPKPLDGLRIVQLSDLHVGPQLTDAFLAEIGDAAMTLSPDLIALTGDYVHHGFKSVDRAAAHLGRLRAPLGVFAVLGNHDYSIRNALGIPRHPKLAATVTAALERHGIRVLRNESAVVERGGAKLAVCGADDLWSRALDLPRTFAGLPADVPRVVLAHNPRTVERLAAGERCDLMLSGHTHGGQVDWPGVGRVTLSRKAKRWAAGLYPLTGGGHLYVHTGVGYGWRFRFNVRPEVVLFRLVRGDG